MSNKVTVDSPAAIVVPLSVTGEPAVNVAAAPATDTLPLMEYGFGARSTGRLGNNMTVYITMRSIAEKHRLNIPHVFPFFFKKPTKYPKTDIKKTLHVGDENLAQILTIDPEPQVSFCADPRSHFQSKESSYNIQKCIIEFLVDDMPDDSDGIFIHHRLGDLVHNEQGSDDRVVKMEYFEKAIESIPNYQQYKSYITSDSPNDDRIKYIIDKYGFELYDTGPLHTVKFGSQFSHKILSLGTFSWWIGILGNQSNVVHPVVQEYPIWHGDIFVFDHWHPLSCLNEETS